MGLADDIADLLVTGGLSSTVHIGELLARPNKAIVVMPTLGQPTIRSFDGAVVENVGCQILARSTSYPNVDDLMTSAHGKLDGLKDKIINGRRYHWIRAAQPPFYIGQDEEERPLFSCNFEILRSAST